MKRYFSAESANGSATSHGFSNDTIVLAFDSKKARDKYVAESSNLSCEAITFDRVTKMAANYNMTLNADGRPDTFRGEFWAIESVEYERNYEGVEGLIGRVTTAAGGNDPNPNVIERLYK